MDADMAARLAASIDPKALTALQNHTGDPTVGRAVAAQFGAFLMQGMMQNADGSALSMAGGTGGPAVSSMFASAMGRYAMSGDKLGLADTIYRSMVTKEGPSANGGPEPADTSSGQAPAGASNHATASSSAGSGISLAPYWQDGGRRPLGAPMGHMSQPANATASEKKGVGLTKPHEASGAAPKQSVSAVKAQSAAPAKTEPQTAQPPHQAARARWEGLSLPMQAHVLLPPAESASAEAPTASAPSAAQASAPSVTSKPAAAANEPIPHGLPWAQPQGNETGTSNRHHAAATQPGNASVEDAENFVEEVAPSIQEAATRLGVSPRILLAQAALETGWGHSVVGNNIFGIKAGASWPGATVTAKTREMEEGHLVAHQSTFRSYANIDQAVNDYVGLVSASGRYRAALNAGDNVAAYAQALSAGGYASDRDYAAKLMAVANSSKMSYAVASLDQEPPGRLVSAHG